MVRTWIHPHGRPGGAGADPRLGLGPPPPLGGRATARLSAPAAIHLSLRTGAMRCGRGRRPRPQILASIIATPKTLVRAWEAALISQIWPRLCLLRASMGKYVPFQLMFGSNWKSKTPIHCLFRASNSPDLSIYQVLIWRPTRPARPANDDPSFRTYAATAVRAYRF